MVEGLPKGVRDVHSIAAQQVRQIKRSETAKRMDCFIRAVVNSWGNILGDKKGKT